MLCTGARVRVRRFERHRDAGGPRFHPPRQGPVRQRQRGTGLQRMEHLPSRRLQEGIRRGDGRAGMVQRPTGGQPYLAVDAAVADKLQGERQQQCLRIL